MLAHTKTVHADALGQHRLFNDVAERFRLRNCSARRIDGDITKSVQPNSTGMSIRQA
jgi:hypothetical protein